MTTEQILNVDIEDIEGLSRSQMAKMISQAARAANIRMKSLREHNITNQATLGAYATGGKFSVAGKDKTALLNEFKRIRSFMGGASTVREAKQENRNIIERMKERGVIDEGDTRSDEDISKEVWEVIDKLRETKPALFVNDCLLYADDVYSEIESGKSPGEVYDSIIDKINQENEQQNEEEQRKLSEWESTLGWDI